MVYLFDGKVKKLGSETGPLNAAEGLITNNHIIGNWPLGPKGGILTYR